MYEVLGKCPKCGREVVTGKYGAFCSGRCGFRVGKLFGLEPDEAQAKELLAGNEVPLHPTSKSTGNEYDVIVKMTGVRHYFYTRKDGSEGEGWSPALAHRFPNYRDDSAGEASLSIDPPDRMPDETRLLAAGAEDLPI